MALTLKTKEVVFPPEHSAIIRQILIAYKLNETSEEIFDKISTGKKSYVATITGLLSQTAREQLSVSQLAENITAELPETIKIAKKLANELYEKVVVLAQSKEAITSPETTEEKYTVSLTAPRKQSNNKDIYREPVE